MTKFAYKNNRKKPPYKSILSYFFFGLMFTWLIVSIYFEVSPIDILKKGVVSIGSVGNTKTIESLELELLKKDSIIMALEQQLNISNTDGLKKAIVKVSSSTLNMRDKASLASDIVLQIPVESEVDILYYDTETYYLEGKQGKWCKIKYAGQEGWVWGNFLLVTQ